MNGLPLAVRYLLILNIGIFLGEWLFRIPFREIFELKGDWYHYPFGFGQLFTYMFIHAGFGHLLTNMLGLFFIGPTVERTVGSYRFFILYYLSGILGGLGWSLLAEPYQMAISPFEITEIYPACLGASGAVMGVLGAFGALYPRTTLLLWFVIPVKAWLLVVLLGIWELSEIIGHQKLGGIANAAHLGGGIVGVLYALHLTHPHIVRELLTRYKKMGGSGSSQSSAGAAGTRASSEAIRQAEVNRILDKIGREGIGALTPQERELLKRATTR